MSRKRLHAIVTGRVQGVFFRDYTQKKARQLNLAGWVRNLPDGTVETVFEGEAGQTEQMLSWLHTGSPSSMVLKVTATEQEPTGEHAGFNVRY